MTPLKRWKFLVGERIEGQGLKGEVIALLSPHTSIVRNDADKQPYSVSNTFMRKEGESEDGDEA